MSPRGKGEAGGAGVGGGRLHMNARHIVTACSVSRKSIIGDWPQENKGIREGHLSTKEEEDNNHRSSLRNETRHYRRCRIKSEWWTIKIDLLKIGTNGYQKQTVMCRLTSLIVQALLSSLECHRIPLSRAKTCYEEDCIRFNGRLPID